MLTNTNARTLPAVVALLLALFCFGNGAAMLVAPMRWFWFVPGVPLTGGYNAHFIRDIGLAYLMAGAALAIGLARTATRLLLWSAAAAWLMGHAVIHLLEVAAGLCGPEAIPRDFLGVTVPGLAACGLVLAAARRPTPPVTSPRAASS
jgi:hypothetical protein